MGHNMLSLTWVTIVGFDDSFCQDYCLQLELHALSYVLLLQDVNIALTTFSFPWMH